MPASDKVEGPLYEGQLGHIDDIVAVIVSVFTLVKDGLRTGWAEAENPV